MRTGAGALLVRGLGIGDFPPWRSGHLRRSRGKGRGLFGCAARELWLRRRVGSAVSRARYQVIVIGGGHAGVEAAWAAANLLGEPRSVALVTIDPSKIGVMSCNPAI